MRRAIVLVALLAASCAATGDGESDGFVSRTIKTLELRRNTADPGGASKPALFQLRNPAGAGTEGTVEAGLSATLVSDTAVQLDATANWNKRSGGAREQDTLAFGVRGYYATGNVLKVLHTFTLDAGFKDERQGNGSGLEARLSYLPAAGNWHVRYVPIGDFDGKRINVQIDPTLSLYYEDLDNIGRSGSDGSNLRGSASLNLRFWPPTEDQDELYFELQGTYWNDLNQSGAFESSDEDHGYFRAGTNYRLTADGSVGLGIEYVNGDNPETGLFDAEYLLATLTVRLGKNENR